MVPVGAAAQEPPRSNAGDIFIANIRKHYVIRYDGASGAFLETLVDDPELQLSFSPIFGPDGHLYVSSAMGLQGPRFDPSSGRPDPTDGRLELVSDKGLAGPENLVVRSAAPGEGL